MYKDPEKQKKAVREAKKRWIVKQKRKNYMPDPVIYPTLPSNDDFPAFLEEVMNGKADLPADMFKETPVKKIRKKTKKVKHVG